MTTATKKTKASRPSLDKPSADPAAWSCLECGATNHAWRPVCDMCGGDVRDGALADLAADVDPLILADVLTPDNDADDAWHELYLAGKPTDARIRIAIAAILRSGEASRQTDEGPITWKVDERGNAEIWIGEDEPPTRKADIAGKTLIKSARQLFDLDHAAANKRPAAGETKTARKQPARRKSGTKTAEVTVLEIDVEQIERFPLNPRDELEFDEGSLRQLGEKLQRRQAQACAVRKMAADRFQLIAGERRWRAAKLVGMKTIRCEIHEVDEATAVEMCGEENEERADWSPIARARWYRAMKDAHGLSDTDLAERIGISQSQATISLQLLKLSEQWQRMLITGQLSQTVARPLLPWCDDRRPPVMPAVEKILGVPWGDKPARRDFDARPITAEEMKRAVFEALKKSTRSMNTGSGSWKPPGAPLFSLTPKRRKELDVEQLQIDKWVGKVERAWNVKRWEELQREAKKKQRAKASQDAGKSSAASGPAKSGKSQVDLNALEAELRLWQARLIAETLTPNDSALAARLLLTGLVSGDVYSEATEELTGKPYANAEAIWQALAKHKGGRLTSFVVKLAAGVLRRLESFQASEFGDVLNEAGRELSIDWRAAWKPTAAQLDAWPEDLLKRLRIEGISELAELAKDKADLVAAIVPAWPAEFLPKEVEKLLGLTPKTKRKTKARKAAK